MTFGTTRLLSIHLHNYWVLVVHVKLDSSVIGHFKICTDVTSLQASWSTERVDIYFDGVQDSQLPDRVGKTADLGARLDCINANDTVERRWSFRASSPLPKIKALAVAAIIGLQLLLNVLAAAPAFS